MKSVIWSVVLILMCAACADMSAPAAEPEPVDEDDRPAELLMAFGVATFERNRLYGQLAHLYGGHVAGQPMPLVEVRLTDIRGEARQVDVTVEVDGWASPSRHTVEVLAGRTIWVSASPRLDLAKIYRQTHLASATVTVTVAEQGRVLVRQHKPLEIQPIEQFTWFAREGADDPLEDMRPFLATMIRPGDTGRDGGRDAFAQVRSLYARLGRCDEIDDAYFQRASQIRLTPEKPLDVVACVVWFAGALEAAGIEVALVFLSDHLLLGFRANGRYHFLDLTVGQGVEQAVEAGNRLFLTGQADPLFRFISLKALRRMGISPMPY